MNRYIKEIIKIQKEKNILTNKLKEKLQMKDVIEQKILTFNLIDLLEEELHKNAINKARGKILFSLSWILIVVSTFVFFYNLPFTISKDITFYIFSYMITTLVLYYNAEKSKLNIKRINKLEAEQKMQLEKARQNIIKYGKSYETTVIEKMQIFREIDELEKAIENNDKRLDKIKQEMKENSIDCCFQTNISVETLKEPIKIKRLQK